MYYIQKHIAIFIFHLIVFMGVSAQIQNEVNFEGKLENYLQVLQKSTRFSGEVLVAKGNTILFQIMIHISFEHKKDNVIDLSAMRSGTESHFIKEQE